MEVGFAAGGAVGDESVFLSSYVIGGGDPGLRNVGLGGPDDVVHLFVDQATDNKVMPAFFRQITVLVANAYNDTRHPYIKFGVYKAAWKVHQDYRVRRAALSYAAFRVGDEHATYDEVSTAPTGLRL